jgi:hypothetical protein
MRLGQRELWMGLTLLVLMVLYGLSFVAMLLPLLLIVGVGAAAGGGGGAGGGRGAGDRRAGGPRRACCGVASRLSVALPMSFAQSAFILPRGLAADPRARRAHLPDLPRLFAILLLGELLLLGVGFGLVAALVPLPELGRAFTQNPAKLFSQVNPAVWGRRHLRLGGAGGGQRGAVLGRPGPGLSRPQPRGRGRGLCLRARCRGPGFSPKLPGVEGQDSRHG